MKNSIFNTEISDEKDIKDEISILKNIYFQR